MKIVSLFFVTLALSIVSCSFEDKENKAQELIDKSIKAYGQQHFDNSALSFVFRDKSYTVLRTSERFIYTRSFYDSLDYIKDVLINSTDFTRTVNGDTIALDEEWTEKYRRSVNSVLYFVQLPYILNDPAVRKSYMGTTNIAGDDYYAIQVTFKSEDGGEDFDDEFYYWINTKNYMMDYFAYRYSTEGGGVRFREAFHRHKKKGIMFQNYINYDAPLDVPLADLPKLFETDQLNELSRIEQERVQVFRKKE
jgi:hypothetical protein